MAIAWETPCLLTVLATTRLRKSSDLPTFLAIPRAWDGESENALDLRSRLRVSRLLSQHGSCPETECAPVLNTNRPKRHSIVLTRLAFLHVCRGAILRSAREVVLRGVPGRVVSFSCMSIAGKAVISKFCGKIVERKGRLSRFL